MFITPALSQVGLTESQAADLKLPYAVKEIPVAAMPRGHVNGDLLGAFKAVVNTETKEILGASIFSRRFSRNHQHHYCCYGQQDSLTLTSQNKSSLTQPWLRT